MNKTPEFPKFLERAEVPEGYATMNLDTKPYLETKKGTTEGRVVKVEAKKGMAERHVVKV